MTHTALLKRFNELAAKATPGKWKAEGKPFVDGDDVTYAINTVDKYARKTVAITFHSGSDSKAMQKANAKFIAGVKDLLDLANAQDADIAELVACLRKFSEPLYIDALPFLQNEARALLERIGHE